jgi:regulator-associated protein of mTOR
MTAVAVQPRHPQQPQSYYSPAQSPRSNGSRPNTHNTPPSHSQQSQQSSLSRASHSTSSSQVNGGRGAIQSGTVTSNRLSQQGPNGAVIAHQMNNMANTSANSTPRMTNGNTTRDRRQSDGAFASRRPQSSGNLVGQNRDYEDSERDSDTSRRRPKPLLTRSKSDYIPRQDSSAEEPNEYESQDWGARHGFEDHYASEEYVNQLANVSSYLPLLFPGRL